MPEAINMPAQLRIPVELAELLVESAGLIARESIKAYRIKRNSRRDPQGLTLRPGRETPLWNGYEKKFVPTSENTEPKQTWPDC